MSPGIYDDVSTGCFSSHARLDMGMRRVIFYFLFFLRTSSAQGGGGGRCQTGGGALPDFFFFFSPCSADHERDWPLCKVVFFGLATNALNVRNNSNNSY